MPIYEYHCESCNKNMEIIQKISDEPLKKCPDCGKKVEKLLSNSAFHLKGSGWYKTDYASGGTQSTSTELKTAKPAEKPSPKEN